jgi:hypothetical protein
MVIQLAPKVGNRLIDGAGAMIHFESPHVGREFIPRNDAPDIGAEIIEQALFGWSEHKHETARQEKSFGSGSVTVTLNVARRSDGKTLVEQKQTRRTSLKFADGIASADRQSGDSEKERPLLSGRVG